MKIKDIKELQTSHENELIEALRLFYQEGIISNIEVLNDSFYAYVEFDNLEFWKKQINLNNVLLFFNLDELKEMAWDYLSLIDDWNSQEAKIDFKNNLIKLNNKNWGPILDFLKIEWISPEIESLVEMSETLEEELTEISVILKPKNFKKGLIEIKSAQKNIVPIWVTEKISKPILAITLCTGLFSTPLYAEDQTKDAIRVATEQALEISGYKKTIKQKSKQIGQKIKAETEDTVYAYPAYAVAYGLKVVADGGVEVKGRIDTTKYEINLNLDDSYLKLSQQHHNAQYYIKSSVKEINLGFSYEW